ncbi:MAG: hypothetical protein KGS61_03340 [Verrucomicrobia bacterium]|nr:hypothetical protein [Verrucomicrobiota bacterium]
MNVSKLEKHLLAAARAQRPSEAVPYAFEKRVMARLADRGRRDWWAAWAAVLWRAAAPSLAVMLAAGLCALWLNPANNASDTQNSDLETTVYAGLDNLGEAW